MVHWLNKPHVGERKLLKTRSIFSIQCHYPIKSYYFLQCALWGPGWSEQIQSFVQLRHWVGLQIVIHIKSFQKHDLRLHHWFHWYFRCRPDCSKNRKSAKFRQNENSAREKRPIYDFFLLVCSSKGLFRATNEAKIGFIGVFVIHPQQYFSAFSLALVWRSVSGPRPFICAAGNQIQLSVYHSTSFAESFR